MVARPEKRATARSSAPQWGCTGLAFAEYPVHVEGACYDADLGEFVLPYMAVRTAFDPSGTLLRFLLESYETAAVSARWDRSDLEMASDEPPPWTCDPSVR